MLANHGGVSLAAREQGSWQLAVGTMLCDTLVQGLSQYVELNMGMLRTTLEQGNLVARQFAAARDARQVLSLSVAQVQPGVQRSLDYGYYLATIVAGMQSGVLRVFAVDPDTAAELRARLRLADPGGWMAALSSMRTIAESALQLPADTARAMRLVLNLNASPSETGKLHIVYAGPGR